MSKETPHYVTRFTAPVRRLGGSGVAHLGVVVVGLGALMVFTVPELRKSEGAWLSLVLWCCFAFFLIEAAQRAHAAFRAEKLASYLFSSSGFIDVLGVVPVPVALLCGEPAPTAWLFAALWILKLAQDSREFARLGRVFVLEAKPLASVAVLFLIVLFLAAVAMHVIERKGQPEAFGTVPHSLWWAVVTLTTTGYGDEVPQTALGRLLGGLVMVCGIATFGLWTGILANGFAAESRRSNFIQTWDIVSKVPFFQTLDPSAITEVTHMLRRVEMPERTAVVRRGRVGDCMYFIAEGEVQVDVEPTPVRLGTGAFFGEMALLGNTVRSANVSTTQPSTLLILDLADFRTLTAHHPELARIIEAEGKRRMSDNQRRRELQVHGGA
jgi:voltage-gated potassium channel